MPLKILSLLLFPFACLYNAITFLRNFLFDIGFLKSESFDVPIICIGNLRVGGTGKTPFIEFLINEYKSSGWKISILSRGYGRKTKGFVVANEKSTSQDIGDEPLQYFAKFKDSINVYVDEKRPHGIKSILQKNSDTEIILLDDAFQHRPLTSKINILLTEFNRPFYDDFLLPFGRLRESRTGARRADIVVVSKCPETLNQNDRKKIEVKINKYARISTPIFYTKIKYSNPLLGLGTCNEIPKRFNLICGIDNPGPFISHCEKEYLISSKFVYNDHYEFSLSDISEMKKNNLPVLTTEKDFARLKVWKKELLLIPVFYLPINIEFLSGREVFFKILNEKVNVL